MQLPDLFRQHFGRPLSGIDALTTSKGEALYRAGRVRSLEQPGPGLLEGKVDDGRGGEARASVTLTETNAAVRVAVKCTCPAGRDCEHGAALVMAWLLEGRPASAGEALEDAVDGADRSGGRWNGTAWHGPGWAAPGEAEPPATASRLQTLGWVRGLQSVRAGGRARAAGARLVYVLRAGGREPTLEVWRLRRHADGQSTRAERYRTLREQAHEPPAYWDEVDVQAAAAFAGADASPGGALSLARAGARDALLALAERGRLFLESPPAREDAPALRVGQPRAATLAWAPESDSTAIRLGIAVDPPSQPVYLAEPAYVDTDAGLFGVLLLELPPGATQWLREAPAVGRELGADLALALQAQLRAQPALRALVPEVPGQAVREVAGEPRPVLGLFLARASAGARKSAGEGGARAFLAVSLAVEYGGRRHAPLRASTVGVQDDAGPVLLLCDPVAERRALSSLREALAALGRDEAGLSFAGADGNARGAGTGWMTVATMPADGVAAARVKHELAPHLAASGWVLADHAELPTRVLEPDAIELGAQLAPGRHAGGNDWFALQTGVRVGDRHVDLAPLLADVIAAGGFEAWARHACPQGVYWLKLGAGEVLRLDAQRIEPLARVVADWAEAGAAEAEAGPPVLFVDRFALVQIALAHAALALPVDLRALRDVFANFAGVAPVEPPPSFRASLRPYQRDGLAWLQFVARAGLGGVLADDMGLGKTVQVLAHLACEQADGRLDLPVLVIAPTSVVFNWQAEAARHAPTLRVLTLTGPQRARDFDAIGEHDVVLTSYALLPRDADALLARSWHAVVADEAQTVKNARTRAATVIGRLPARHRIALTGTPLENHLGELWSVMQFALPGLLGGEASFRARYRGPIERRPGTDAARERLQALERRIKPFVLRRTKAGVLGDLPPRTEIIERVELASDQRDLYESIRVAMDRRVREALAGGGLAGSQIVVLDALLKLRQACCDPALVKLPAAARVARSAKRDALLALLTTLVDEGRRALVFSQFTSMLDLIEAAIDRDPRLAKVPRTRLDGDTIARGEVVERFQQGDAQLFLLSLKAGGVGLNLTAADTVIHYDPWWNPAVEQQATDRAHRIGQDKPVFVYKLIASGTVEERILALQARKAELVAAVLSGTLSQATEGLSQDDLLGLFEAG